METKTIDITPTWSGLLRSFLLVLETTDKQDVRDEIMRELTRMASLADKFVAAEKQKEVNPLECPICGGTETDMHDFEFDGANVTGMHACSECGCSYNSYYTLDEVEIIEQGEVDDLEYRDIIDEDNASRARDVQAELNGGGW